MKLEDYVQIYVSKPVYPDYLAPSVLPADASLIALSTGYIADEEDPAEYLTDGGDDDDESSDHDDDDDDDDEEED
nr:hypothetical protein [Tanacetum cinerariifolium]